MLKNVTFSIIIPVYQVEAYLQECIDSVLNQSFQDYEIWLINDGSRDQSPAICDAYAKQDARIHVLHKQNEGLSAARNDGMKRASGAYIIFLDSDDTLTKDALQALYECIIKVHPVDMVTGFMDSDIVPKHTLRNNEKISIEHFLTTELKAQTMSNAACLYIYRNEFIQTNRFTFPVGIHHEDEYFTPRALLKAESILPTDVTFYHYRVNEASITNNTKNFDKNYKDLCSTLKGLEPLYQTVSSQALKALLMESLLEKYLYAFAKAQGYQKHLLPYAMDDFVKHKAISNKNKFKVCLYTISKKLYCKIATR